jgi:hypothetical protein
MDETSNPPKTGFEGLLWVALFGIWEFNDGPVGEVHDLNG